MSDHVTTPTTEQLVHELKGIKGWQSLGFYLGLGMAEIKEIEQDHPDISSRRMAMLEKWMRKEDNPSWKMVVEALEKISELRLANQLREKYCTQQLVTQPEIGTIRVYHRDAIVQEMENITDKYLELVRAAELALNNANPSAKNIKRFSAIYLEKEVRTVDELFDQMSPFNFLDYKKVEKVIHLLLTHDQSMISKLNDYIQQLEEFKSSTTVKQFVEAAQTPYCRLIPDGGLLHRTVKNLDMLLKEQLWQNERSVLAHLQIDRGDSKSQSANTPTATPTSTDTTSQKPGDEDHTSTTADEDTHTTSPDAVGTQNRNLVKQYIERQGSLPVRSLKSFFIGPPCVGKTSARRRLTGEIKHISSNEIVPSTGIDAPLTVRLHHPTEHSSVLLSEGWHNQGLEEQCHALCSYALNSPAPPPVLSSSTSATSSAITTSPVSARHQTKPLSKLTETTVTTTQDAAKATQNAAATAQDELTTALTTLVKADDWKSIRDFLTNIKELAFLNIVDIGGQPEFHEILPLLLHGLALNLIFLNTTQDLDSPYAVEYRDGAGNNSPQYTSESTTRQVIQRALCAILSLQTSDEENKSAAILIGTYCDHADKSAVLALDQSIQESFKEADFMKKDVLCAVNKPGEKRRYIYPLDNVSGDPSEIDELRQLISTIVYDRFKPVMVPTSALLLHLILRMKFGHTRGWCTLEECIEIAKNCGISRDDLLREDGILQYLHDKFGTVLYYRKVNKLCLRVIVDTNVIMGPPSRLFLMAFGALKTKQQTAEHIRATGEISHYLMTKVCSRSLDDGSDDDIPTEEIVELLKARYIIFEDVRSYSNEPVYFMPALLYPDHNVAKESSDPDLLASLPFPPVVFLPSSGDVPLGLFPAIAVNLSKHWKPDENSRKRNRIRFYAKCKHERLLHVELRYLSTYLEFRVLPQPSIDTSLMVESIQMLWKVFDELSPLYSYTRYITWSVGFYCPHSLLSGRQPHTATCNSKDNPQQMICSHDGGLVPLNDKHKSWFRDTATTAREQHLNQECSDIHFAEISISIVDWREIAPFLGLTAAEEIVIRDSTNSVPSQKIALLRKWKEKLGTKATYKCLCQAFEACEKYNLVELVKQLAASSSSSES